MKNKTTYYHNGNIENEYFKKNGLWHGIQKYYLSNGKRRRIRIWKKELMHGPEIYFNY